MYGTFCSDLHQLRVLFCGQRSSQFDFNVNSVEHTFLGFAFLAIHCMNARVPQRNLHVLERELFPARVETDRHGSADAETDQQVIVRIRSRVAASGADRFVRNKAMLTSNDFLLEAAYVAPHDDVRCLDVGLCSHNQSQARRIPANAARYRHKRNNSRTVTTIAGGTPSGAIKM